MQTVERPSAQAPSPSSDDPGYRRLVAFLAALWKLKSIRRVAWGDEPYQTDLWIIQRTEDYDEAEEIHRLARAYNREAAFTLEAHVVLPMVGEENLPPVVTIWER